MKVVLTDFQLELERSIADVLEHLGKQVVDRRVAGVSETHVMGGVEGQDLTFWIYPEGAAFLAGRRHRAFERPDYEGILDLVADFLAEFTKAVQGRGTEPGASGNRLSPSRN